MSIVEMDIIFVIAISFLTNLAVMAMCLREVKKSRRGEDKAYKEFTKSQRQILNLSKKWGKSKKKAEASIMQLLEITHMQMDEIGDLHDEINKAKKPITVEMLSTYYFSTDN